MKQLALVIACALVALSSCKKEPTTANPRSQSSTPTSPQGDTESNMETAVEPSPTREVLAMINSLASSHEHIRLEAESYVVKHADQSHPLMTNIVRKREYNWILLPQFIGMIGREESVALLRTTLFETKDSSVAYGLALHKSPNALTALLDAFNSDSDELISAAAYGLANRGDSSVCPVLKKKADVQNAELRFHVTLALTALECFSTEELQKHLNDPNPHVRELIKKALKTSPK